MDVIPLAKVSAMELLSTFLLSLLLSLLLCCLFIFLLLPYSNTSNASFACLPPGPRPLPIIGNLHLLTSHPHRAIIALSKAYGPILLLRLGSIPTIFISSPRLAEQVFRSHDAAVSNRPPTEAAYIFSYDHKDMGFTDYGPQWRRLRKLCMNNLLGVAKLESYEFIRREEMGDFIKQLEEASSARATVDVTAKVWLLAANMACRIVMGRRFIEEGVDGTKFSEHVEEMMRILGLFNLNDAMPWLKPFDLQGMRRKMKAARKHLDEFLEKIISEHIRLREGGKRQNDFIDKMLDSMNDEGLEPRPDASNVKAVILNMFFGAIDTSPITVDWAFVELLRHPKAMRKAKEELDRVVGTHRAVEESDIPKLSYLRLVIKETFRLHQITPFIFRHTKRDIAIDKYCVPGGSNIMICVWAMGRDPSLWDNAEEFIPERFENSSIDLRGHDYELLPFGSGRRICPGMNFGLLVVSLVLAQLVHCFDWELPSGMSPAELDMKEKYGLSLPRTAHLRATPIHRLVRN